MNNISLSQLAEHLKKYDQCVSLSGKDLTVKTFSTDTRTLNKGDVYIALIGENFNGHDFTDQAREAGASALIVNDECNTDLPQIVVPDTKKALGLIAKLWRDALSTTIVAITGSCGKTTLKEILATILSLKGNCLYTQGNYNNDIGLPLTLLRLTKEHEFAVIEMGANHPGEIDNLSRLVSPKIAVINNAGSAHLEGFGSVEGVARAKAEIYHGLKEDGIAIFNYDDAHASLWQNLTADRTQLTFGMNKQADVYATECKNKMLEGMEFILNYKDHKIKIQLPLLGEHNIYNALAAASAAISLGIELETIQAGLQMVAPVKGRMIKHPLPSGAIVIDDSYNANPKSVTAAIEVLSTCEGQRALVLGDMGELGDNSEQFHFELGKLAREKGIDYLFSVGELSSHAAKAFGNGGKTFPNQQTLIEQLNEFTSKGCTLLIKGSNSSGMGKVVQALTKNVP